MRFGFRNSSRWCADPVPWIAISVDADESAVVIGEVRDERHVELALIGKTHGGTRLPLNLRNRNEHHRDDERDDRDHHQQFDQGESERAMKREFALTGAARFAR